MRTRLAIGVVGVAMGLFGALRLLQVGFADLVDAVLWLAGGVLLHDAVLAPLTIALTWLGTRVVPPRWRTRVVVAAVVLGTVTLAAIPVLGRFGARSDNPTLLDRHYGWGWLAIVVLVLLGVLLSGLVPRRRRQGGEAGSAG